MCKIPNVCPKIGYGLVYCYTFDNGKKYIGITTTNFIQRHKTHLYGKQVVDYAIRKRKYNVEIIDEVPIDELNDAEIRYISEFNCLKPNGYNISIGGEFAGYSRRLEVRCTETGEERESVSTFANVLGVQPCKISEVCWGHRDSVNKLHFEFVDWGLRTLGEFNNMARRYSAHLGWERYKEEHKEECSNAGKRLARSNRGKKYSETHRKHISEALKARANSLPKKSKQVKTSYDRHRPHGPMSEEQKKKISESVRGKNAGFNNGMYGRTGRLNPKSKQVVAYDEETMENLGTFGSATEAGRHFGRAFQIISAICIGTKKRAIIDGRKVIFRYI